MLRRCRVCKSFRLTKVFDLGKQPLANQFTSGLEPLKKYPLELYQCQHCTLLQLGKVVPKEEMYEEYYYIPSVSKTGMKHFGKLAHKLKKELKLKPDDLVVDIGGNDGSLLSFFSKQRTINVDPAKNIAIKPGIKAIRDYFSPEVAETIVRIEGQAKLVTATNCLAHVDNLQEFLAGLDILLAEDGVFFAQFPDARNLLKENQFDTIYHEHLSYFTYEPLHHLFANSPFELFNITSDNIHGGSMQIWVRRRPKLIYQFRENSWQIIHNLRQLLEDNSFKRIVGFAAAAKGTVLLNAIGQPYTTAIDYIVDGTPYKQGKFMPGVDIPIVPEEELLKEEPGTVVLILAWNFKEEIINKLKNRGFTFVIPVPKVEVIKG